MSKNKLYNTNDDTQGEHQLEEQEKPLYKYKKTAIAFLEKNPKKIFIWMVAILIISVVLNVIISIFYQPEPVEISAGSTSLSIDPISTGIGQILDASSALAETAKLKENINTLLSKEALSQQDSVKLLLYFEELSNINKKLSPIKPIQK